MCALIAAALAAATSGPCPAAAASRESAARGKAIYTTGVSPRGRELMAELVGGVETRAELHPCARCHGFDGRGGVEGGLAMSKISWSHLTAPHGVPTYLGGTRPPYTEATVRRAIREGRDSGGAPLDALMPRYTIDDADLADLMAYMRVLGTEDAPGTNATTIRVGGVLPFTGPLANQGRAVATVLSAYFDRINAGGGIHGRRLEYVTRDAGATVDSARQVVLDLLDSEGGVFCFVANGGLGAAPAVSALLAKGAVPLVGPLTFTRHEPDDASTFFVLPTLNDQGRAAARFLAREMPAGETIAVAREASAGAREMADGFIGEAERLALRLVVEEWSPGGDAAELLARLRRDGTTRLVLLGAAADAERVLDASVRDRWTPPVVASAVVLGGPLRATGGLLLITPPLAPTRGHPGAEEFFSLAGTRDASEAAAPEFHEGQSRAMEMAAFASGKVFVESLKRAGRDLQREAFVDTLQRTSALETGVMPPITFGPNRRHGVRGALLVEMDGAGRLADSDWVDVGDEPELRPR
jgi:ABC-type branched-subunit amino acid transport system substrate-binding protein